MLRLGSSPRILAIAALSGAMAVIGVRPGGALAATLCVNTGGTGGCYSTIQAAVSAAHTGDTVNVAAGTYTETGITITSPILLHGAGAGSTIVNATGHKAGLTLSGLTSGPSEVSGFTIENAGLQGIFVVNSSQVTIQNNTLTGNDKSLNFNPQDINATNCPDNPNPFLADDCGEAINLQGVSASTVSNNVVQHNAGGILLDDETGATFGNTISNNVVTDNVLDCGITLASHSSGMQGNTPLPGYGVHDNKIIGNTVSRNGAAGVGNFASVPGDAAYNNVIQDNILTDNGLPGVTMHAHAPNQNLNGNQVIGNTISGNAVGAAGGPPPGDASAADQQSTGILIMSAVSPVTKTVIKNNTISNQSIGIWLTNVVAPLIAGNANHATTPVAQLAANSVPPPTGPVTLPNGAPAPPPTMAVPLLTIANAGISGSFTVSFNSKSAGQGEVFFGPSCSSLVAVATQDKGAGTTSHTVTVTGNDLPGTVGDVGIIPGQTYAYEVMTLVKSGNEKDDNSGQCYSVTIPQS